jgi:hypothetical protein
VLECLIGMILLHTLKQRDTTTYDAYSEQHMAVVIVMHAARETLKMLIHANSMMNVRTYSVVQVCCMLLCSYWFI